MKRFLAMSFLLLSTAVIAQNTRPSQGCSVLIGRNWIPMSATSINGCFKFAEAASTPGERQLAAFNSTSLAFKDGQYFLSNDGGSTWVNAHPRQAQSVMSSLNRLPPSKEEIDAAAKAASAESRLVVQEPPVMPAPVPVPIQPQAYVPELPVPLPVAQPQPQQIQTPPVVALTQSTPVTANTSATGSTALYVCQLKDAEEKWHRYLTATIAECGAKLADATVKSGAKSGQAYWDSKYLFYSGSVVYQSTDGDRWQPLE